MTRGPTARGFAVMIDGKIDPRTVYPHGRGTMVNWLVTEGHRVTDDTSDAEIEAMWKRHRGEAELIAVEIRATV